MRFKFGFPVLLAIIAALAAAPAILAQSTLELNNEALHLVQEGHYAAAVEKLEAARRVDPANAVLRTNLAMALNAWGVTLGEKGDFEQALRRLEEALRVAPQERVIARNLAVMRGNAANMHLQRGELETAERLLDLAATSAPRELTAQLARQRAHLRLLQGRRAHVAGDLTRARIRFEQALELDHQNVAALVDLGELLYAQGDSAGALSLWMDAEQLDPDIANLAEKIDRVSREVQAEEGFSEQRSRHFTVAYEGDKNEAAARQVLTILNRAWREIGGELDYYTKRPLGVVLYTREQYEHVTLAPHWSGALYDGKIRVPIPSNGLDSQEGQRLRTMLYHEFTHALVHELTKQNVPSWINEGLATYYELERADRERRADREARRLKELADRNALPPIATLPHQFTSVQDPDQAEVAYMAARNFTAWLADRYRATRFRTLLSRLDKGETMDEALKSTYGKTLEQLDGEWRRSLS